MLFCKEKKKKVASSLFALCAPDIRGKEGGEEYAPGGVEFLFTTVLLAGDKSSQNFKKEKRRN